MKVLLRLANIKPLCIALETEQKISEDVNFNFYNDRFVVFCSDLETDPTVVFEYKMTRDEIERNGRYTYEKHRDDMEDDDNDGGSSVGVHLPQFNRIMKTMNDGDVLTLEINSYDSPGIMTIWGENDRGKNRMHTVNLLTMNRQELQIAETNWNDILNISSVDFHTECKNSSCSNATSLKNTHLVLCNTDTALFIQTYSDYGSGIIALPSDVMVTTNDLGKMVINAYSYRYIMLFAKAYKLDPTIRVHMSNDMPIIMEYIMPTSGIFRVCMAPKNMDETLKMKHIEMIKKLLNRTTKSQLISESKSRPVVHTAAAAAVPVQVKKEPIIQTKFEFLPVKHSIQSLLMDD